MGQPFEPVPGGQLVALGHSGSGSYVGLEIIDLEERMAYVEFRTDEFTAVCPVTGQPDQYDLEILLENTEVSIESKSLKIYLGTYRNQGAFCENLAARIKADVFDAIRSKGNGTGARPFFEEDQLEVTICQKARGGIEIEAAC